MPYGPDAVCAEEVSAWRGNTQLGEELFDAINDVSIHVSSADGVARPLR